MFNAQYFRTFITLVETGSFTRTARRLEMTQPGVSQHVRKLEQYLGRSLLERQGRRFALTEAGRRAYDYALKLFAEHEQFRHSLDDESLDSGECRLASPGSVGLMLYPFILGQQQMHTGLTVSYSFAFNHEIVSDVLAGRHDLGIVTEAVRHPEVDCEVWHQEPLCLVVPADFAGTGLADLMGIGFISYSDGVNHADTLLRCNFPQEFRSMSHFPRQGFTNEVSMVLDAVARGLGFTVVSRLVLETSPWQRQVKELSLPQPVHETLHLVTRRGSRMPRRYARLLDAFREHRRHERYGHGEPSMESVGAVESGEGTS
ncbi:LysR family transcriptional regulator [Halomonas elongata]|uniref:LysR family transcription regulator n=1 Tax=Halomonas elongata (strain ATCC 33173 / DSM 2581 / NBRC 15536 / NCIMB 2198 / 1H9) TaxID=768066 RepID=E1VCQ4_HALED|nr:LysR family transcriptional regulator [Halomonas elongata]RAW08851.1 LysR family transcriptional regulator [Halomonas elongata]WBF19693.1 LysR family transcriptional regulator [Halomonas elongata]WPU48558.1 LysR family transcriptional regulator [Halomonas elongata DSM 2581]CBV42409.2 LysR family transcription regulator [Halomonas elongata DSM 2581]